MTTIQVQTLGERAVLPRTDLEKLIELARRSEPLDIKFAEDDLTSAEWTQFALAGGSFDFWKEEGEDIYTLEDGEPI